MIQMKNIKLIFIFFAATFVLAGIYLALIHSPTHPTMGDVQRIFYFHVASAWVAYLAFGVTFVACIIFLKTNAMRWDVIAASSAEIGVVYCTIAITTGPLWGKAV